MGLSKGKFKRESINSAVKEHIKITNLNFLVYKIFLINTINIAKNKTK